MTKNLDSTINRMKGSVAESQVQAEAKQIRDRYALEPCDPDALMDGAFQQILNLQNALNKDAGGQLFKLDYQSDNDQLSVEKNGNVRYYSLLDFEEGGVMDWNALAEQI